MGNGLSMDLGAESWNGIADAAPKRGHARSGATIAGRRRGGFVGYQEASH